MSSLSFFIPGKIQGKQRPRFSKKSVYTPVETVNYEKKIKFLVRKKINESKINIPFDGPIEVNIKAFKTIPSYKKNKVFDGDFCQSKPDCDNIIKVVLDSLNKIVFDDDKQVAKISLLKCYTDDDTKEGVAVMISKLTPQFSCKILTEMQDIPSEFEKTFKKNYLDLLA
jgi:Holliday junction resolvase RusA-like endonuclease